MSGSTTRVMRRKIDRAVENIAEKFTEEIGDPIGARRLVEHVAREHLDELVSQASHPHVGERALRLGLHGHVRDFLRKLSESGGSSS